MKKVLVFCTLFLLLLSSCATSEALSYEERSEEENTKASLALISSEKEALANLEASLFRDSFNIMPNDSLILYSNEIPLFSSTLNEYYKSIQNVILDIIPSLVDTTNSYLDSMVFIYPYYFIEKNDSSVTKEIQNNYRIDLYNIVLSHIETNASTLLSSYSNVEREALIWKRNQENLQSVSVGKTLVDPIAISNEEIASFVMDVFFKELAKAEENIRTRPLSAVSNDLYTVFWEHLSYE